MLTMQLRFHKSKQVGAVLFTGLIILVVLSLVAVTSMQGATLEERMAGNSKDEFIAFEAAEAALVAAEALITSGALTLTNFQVGDTDGLYKNDSDTIHQDIDWGSEAIDVSEFNPAEVTTPPKFVIQYISETAPPGENRSFRDESYGEPGSSSIGNAVQLFRVTARGTGGSDDTVVFLQSVFGAQW